MTIVQKLCQREGGSVAENDPFQAIMWRLRVIRFERGLKQIALASQIGVSNRFLSLCETGRRRPSSKVLRKWLDALGMDLELRERG